MGFLNATTINDLQPPHRGLGLVLTVMRSMRCWSRGFELGGPHCRTSGLMQRLLVVVEVLHPPLLLLLLPPPMPALAPERALGKPFRGQHLNNGLHQPLGLTL
ncbi:hypothetical protein Ddye_028552 [Dipteronia dyeriana]|uniref:Uncharacterized protein n=1 Tax=Dipteronia dyeriana TaxID=168575 RepID=A0AAD9TDJ6_9ROSI|nr:hypothetical protein Ddye_028552 [Dipteronia dyeriana]